MGGDEAASSEPVRTAYLEAAACTVTLLRSPAVATAWQRPSALQQLSVSGLAGHLARAVLQLPEVLAAGPPDEEPVGLLVHYTRSAWVEADLDAEVNATIRTKGEQAAADGAAALAARTAEVLDTLRTRLPAEPADRVVHLPWGPWSLTLDDFLVTRMVEIAVHVDDLAESVGQTAPALPATVTDPVLDVLARTAARRHGATAVMRVLARAERASYPVAAF